MMDLEGATRAQIAAHQLQRLQEGLRLISAQNRFYERKFAPAGLNIDSIQSIADLARLPFTFKRELIADQEEYPPFGSNLTYAPSAYIRLHQTSGTTGRPLKILDTQKSWDWWAQCWESVYRVAGVTKEDVLFLAFSFGPFIGFWSAYEGAKRVGTLTVPWRRHDLATAITGPSGCERDSPGLHTKLCPAPGRDRSRAAYSSSQKLHPPDHPRWRAWSLDSRNA